MMKRFERKVRWIKMMRKLREMIYDLFKADLYNRFISHISLYVCASRLFNLKLYIKRVLSSINHEATKMVFQPLYFLNRPLTPMQQSPSPPVNVFEHTLTNLKRGGFSADFRFVPWSTAISRLYKSSGPEIRGRGIQCIGAGKVGRGGGSLARSIRGLIGPRVYFSSRSWDEKPIPHPCSCSSLAFLIAPPLLINNSRPTAISAVPSIDISSSNF